MVTVAARLTGRRLPEQLSPWDVVVLSAATHKLSRRAPFTSINDPARPIVVVGLDATLIEADSNKAGAAGTYKGGYGFHPLTAWCTNVGDNLAVMLRPGNAGSFTAADHVALIDAAIAQIPAAWRADVLVTVDGAGASHDVINHLTGLNTHATHGKRGRRVEYSIGWPVDERTEGTAGGA